MYLSKQRKDLSDLRRQMGNYFLARKIEEVRMQVLGLDLENSYSCLGSGESTAALVSLY